MHHHSHKSLPHPDSPSNAQHACRFYSIQITNSIHRSSIQSGNSPKGVAAANGIPIGAISHLFNIRHIMKAPYRNKSSVFPNREILKINKAVRIQRNSLVPDLEVQMRPCRSPCASAQSKYIACFHALVCYNFRSR